MARLLITTLLLGMLAIPASAHNWSSVATKLAEATFVIVTREGQPYCSGFVIDVERDYAVTAGHCMQHALTSGVGVVVDGIEATVEMVEGNVDVAVIHVPGHRRNRELEPYHFPIKVGSEIGVYGWALEHGWGAHFRAGVIASLYPSGQGIWVITDQPYSGGMSGGPVVNTQGKVVSMIQRSDRTFTGSGLHIGPLWRATRQYWAD